MERERRTLTLAYFKSLGVSRLVASCYHHSCRRVVSIPMDGLPDTASLDDVQDRLLCRVCGHRETGLMPDWSSQPPKDPNEPTTFEIIQAMRKAEAEK